MPQIATLCVVLSLLLGIGTPEGVQATVASTSLGITDDGSGFTLDGKPTFLKGLFSTHT